MDDVDRNPPTDALALAEAVAAGRLSPAAAEQALRGGAADARAGDAAVAEFRALLTAIRGVRRHATAYRASSADMPAEARLLDPEGSTHRIELSDVRVRRRPPQRNSRWAPIGAGLAAAVLVIAAVVVGPRLAPSVGATPTPAATPTAIAANPSAAPSDAVPTPPPATATPAASGVTVAPNIPPVGNQPIAGPITEFWSASEDGVIRIWEWKAGTELAGPIVVDNGLPGSTNPAKFVRTVVASPTGRAFVVTEVDQSAPTSRLRIVDMTGRTTYKTESTGGWDIAWSQDGSRVAFGQAFNPLWTGLTAEPDGSWSERRYPYDDGEPRAIVAFSADSSGLFGYKTQGDADFWDRPTWLDLKTGTYRDIKVYPAGLAQSNTVQAISASRAEQIDTKTGLVVIPGTPKGESWSVWDGTPKPIVGVGGGPEGFPVVWGDSGELIVDTIAADAKGRTGGFALGPMRLDVDFVNAEQIIAPGTYRAGLLGVRNGYALIGVGAKVAQAAEDGPPHWDEIVMVELASNATAVAIPSSPDQAPLTFAGWLTAPGR